jgi:hypothetical protein
MLIYASVRRLLAFLSAGFFLCSSDVRAEPTLPSGSSAPDSQAVRRVTVRFKFEPQRKWPADIPTTIVIPALDAPLQTGSYRLTNLRRSKEIEIDGNLAHEVTPNGNQPILLEANLDVLKFDLNPLLNPPPVDQPPLPADALRYLKTSKWIDLTGSLLRRTARPLKAETDIETVRNILQWMKANVNEYKWPRPKPYRGVEDTIRYGYGDCGSWSDLLVALCRANGVPARVVRVLFGYGPSGGTVNTHMESEVFIRGIGWRPILAGILTNATVEEMLGANDHRYVLWFHFPPGTDRWEAVSPLQMAEYMLAPNSKHPTAEVEYISHNHSNEDRPMP